MADSRVRRALLRSRRARLTVAACSCQWSPHPSTSNLILTTSSQKLLVWDLTATSPSTSLHRVIDAHFRAITDINWHAIHPDILASTGVDGGVRAFDLRIKESDAAVIRLSAWGMAGTQVKWNRQHEHILASSHGNEVRIWDTRVRRRRAC